MLYPHSRRSNLKNLLNVIRARLCKYAMPAKGTLKEMKIAYILTLLLAAPSLLNATQEPQFAASSQKISPALLARMKHIWNPESPVPLDDLRYMQVSFYDFGGIVQYGELVVHVQAVDDLMYIFEKLFEVKFPIQSMKLVDEFDGSDDASMSANNSSAFYARRVARAQRWSNHASGLAIDINPLINPYSKGDFFCPKEGERYLDRSVIVPGMITKDSLIYQLFRERGWEWGGECFFERDGVIDRHHFQKIIPGINKNTN